MRVVPPGEPHVELSLKGLKNFQCLAGENGFVAQLTVTELKALWSEVTAQMTAAGIPVTTSPLP